MNEIAVNASTTYQQHRMFGADKCLGIDATNHETLWILEELG